jgi:hypothetical protein
MAPNAVHRGKVAIVTGSSKTKFFCFNTAVELQLDFAQQYHTNNTLHT